MRNSGGNAEVYAFVPGQRGKSVFYSAGFPKRPSIARLAQAGRRKKEENKMTSKKVLAIIVALAMIFSLAACSSGSTEPQGGSEETKSVRIGILQFAPHASLDNCYNGIIEGLKEAGFVDGETCTIDFVNGMGEGETNSMAAQKFVTDGCDIIIAIATPSATAAYAAAKDAGVPVIFSAVSSPTGAGLVKDLNDPQTGCSGTSDNLNYPAQLAMIRAFQPEAKTVGILYTTSEANSVAQIEEYEKIAGDYGFTIKTQGVTDASEIASGIASLTASGIDCLCNLTDNNVVNNFSVVTAVTDPAGIPCYGSEEEQVAQYGCVASETLDYVALGKTTGKMAADVLNGADIMTMPVSIVSDSEPVYSLANLAKFGMEVPADYAGARCVD